MRTHIRAVIALAALATLAACDDDPVSPVEKYGRVRAVHAVTDIAKMDVLFNSTTYKADLDFKASDGYKQVVTGATTVKFREADATTDLVTSNVTVTENGDFTVVAIGTEAAPQSFVLNDNNAAPAAGKAKIRLVHGAAAVGAMDVYILDDIDELEEAEPVKANFAAKAASDYIVKDAGTYVIVFTAAGNKTPLLQINNFQRAAGSVGTVIAVEKSGGGQPLEAVQLADKN